MKCSSPLKPPDSSPSAFSSAPKVLSSAGGSALL